MSKQSHTPDCWYPLKDKLGVAVGEINSYSREYCPESDTYWMTARENGKEYEIRADEIEMIIDFSAAPNKNTYYRTA